MKPTPGKPICAIGNLDTRGWQSLVNQYRSTRKATNNSAPVALRIENTPFASARYAGGMTYMGASYRYVEAIDQNMANHPDETPYIAWLMVREDFLRWAKRKLKQKKENCK